MHIVGRLHIADTRRSTDPAITHSERVLETKHLANLAHRQSLRRHRIPLFVRGLRSGDAIVAGSSLSRPSPTVRNHRTAVRLGSDSVSAMRRISHRSDPAHSIRLVVRGQRVGDGALARARDRMCIGAPRQDLRVTGWFEHANRALRGQCFMTSRDHASATAENRVRRQRRRRRVKLRHHAPILSRPEAGRLILLNELDAADPGAMRQEFGPVRCHVPDPSNLELDQG